MRLFTLRNIIILLVVLCVGYLIFTKLMFHGGAPGSAFGGMGPMPVGVAEVPERTITEWSEYSGRLVAVDQAEIRAQVSGILDKIHFKDGEMVEKGDRLFTIDPRPYEAAMQVAAARASFAESEFKRAQLLMTDKAISQREFDQRKNDAEVARAEMIRARLNLDYTQIKAPISGRVGRAEVTVGNLIETGPNSRVLTTIVASEKLYADFEIDEAHFIKYTQAGVSGSRNVADVPVMMALTGETDFPHVGHIESFDNKVDASSGTIRVRAVFDNADGQLVPGMFSRVRIGGASEQKAVLITDRAVGTDQSKKFVLVVLPDNKTERREVKLGGMAEGLRIVTEGLKPGEKIIVSGMQRVMMPGQEVKPEIVPMDAADAPPPMESPKDSPQGAAS